jgi:molybdopterin-biosynthesis enzyme MoeA-like protein
MFAEGADLLPNTNGTAWGCRAETQGSTVIMLPGPPRECLPMLTAVLRDGLMHIPEQPEVTTVFRRTLGIIEADAAALVDELIRDGDVPVKPAYRWHYPYVDIRLGCPPEAAGDLAARLDAALAAHVVTDQDRTAVQELAVLLDERGLVLDLDDRLTEGVFAAELARERDTSDGPRMLSVSLSGVWEGGNRTTYAGTVGLTCTVRGETGEHTAMLTIPNRGAEVTVYFAQFAAWSVSHYLTGRHLTGRHLTEESA